MAWSAPIIGDNGGLQALLFDTYFATLDLSEYERFPIEYEDSDLRHYLCVVQNCLDDWIVLADFAGWCLPLDIITMSRIDPLIGALESTW